MTSFSSKSSLDKSIPFELDDYFALVDWSGRAILENKRGSIPENTPPILLRLGIDEKDWLNNIRYFERQFPTVAGNSRLLRVILDERWKTYSLFYPFTSYAEVSF